MSKRRRLVLEFDLGTLLKAMVRGWPAEFATSMTVLFLSRPKDARHAIVTKHTEKWGIEVVEFVELEPEEGPK